MQPSIKKLAFVQEYLQQKISVSEACLKSFTEKLQASPATAMEWSGDAFSAAAWKTLCENALPFLEGAETEEKATELLDGFREHLMEHVLSSARNPSRSTSATSNLMFEERAKVSAIVLREALGVR